MPHLPIKNKPIVISGMGCISAAGQNTGKHLVALQQCSRNCTVVPDWLFETQLNYPVFACPENPLTEVGRELLEETGNSTLFFSRTAKLMISAVAEAIFEAGFAPVDLQKKTIGIAMGTTVGCTFNNEEYYKSYRDGETPAPRAVIDFLNGNLAYLLHSILGTSGPSLVITNACASGTDAIGIAGNWLNTGLCDIAIAGGADELSRIAYNGFSALQLTSPSPCRPFDTTRQGLNLGEGAGIVILEKRQNTVKANKIFGLLRGYGASADAWHPTAPHPEGKGLIRAVNTARQSTGTEIDFDLINTHGTATKANDLAETNALEKIINPLHNTAIVSTKGLTGHTLGAAGGIEAILTLLSLNQGISWGTVGCTTPDLGLRITVSAEKHQQKLSGRLGLSQSLAFGGCNAALIFEGWP